jgi:hypothetical protein
VVFLPFWQSFTKGLTGIVRAGRNLGVKRVQNTIRSSTLPVTRAVNRALSFETAVLWKVVDFQFQKLLKVRKKRVQFFLNW